MRAERDKIEEYHVAGWGASEQGDRGSACQKDRRVWPALIFPKGTHHAAGGGERAIADEDPFCKEKTLAGADGLEI